MSDVVQEQEGAVEQAAPAVAAKRVTPETIKITIEHAVFEGKVDLSKLTYKDSKVIRKAQARFAKEEITEDDLTAVMEEIIQKVTGYDPNELPDEVVNAIMDKLVNGDNAVKGAEKN